MQHQHLTEIMASILIVGIALQWIGWRFKIPALILLIIAGFIMGPLTGWINPKEDFGDMLHPIVSLSVAIILFEGGLNLKWHEFKQNAQVINRLITWNVAATFSLGAIGSYYLVGLSMPVALIFGAIIIVTGPTVIVPLLKQANLNRRPAALLRWEGIINDPVGALLVVLIYGYYMLSQSETLVINIVMGLGLSLVVSLMLGVGVGFIVAEAFKKGKVPEHLKSPIILITVFLVYSLANLVQTEAGLMATTILGITLANQKLNSLGELRRFKEYVTILLVSSIFIILTAEIEPEILQRLGWQSWLLLFLIIFVFRPLTIYLSTIRTDIDWHERLLIAWIAPRGIVAAAVAGLFSPQLIEKGYAGAELLLPLVFTLIILTVILHGLSIGWLAKKLGLASSHPDGLMLIGASAWSIALASELQKNEIPGLVVDKIWEKLKPARMQNIPTFYGEILAERTEEVLEISHITKLLALTPNKSYNTLVCSHFAPELGHNNVYEIGWKQVNENENKLPSEAVRGDSLFGSELFYSDFISHFNEGWKFQTTLLSEEFTYEDAIRKNAEDSLVIAVITKSEHIFLYPFEEDELDKALKNLILFVPPENIIPKAVS
ncbi:MAG: sodium:proton antiporter [Helicobacteraceae bacterium]|jgi:NhaP-type Na+/H+ or K+/H+ antiporter|nr:sodium:proton antiporter [Helicobacteraceae bacterium]